MLPLIHASSNVPSRCPSRVRTGSKSKSRSKNNSYLPPCPVQLHQTPHIFHRSQPSQPSAIDACAAVFKASIPHSTAVSVTSHDSATRNLITTFDPDNRRGPWIPVS
ncbi:hypothetical protein M407DRAFT_246688 [Tulasnella calospora MUT 4182]|uniref:Uncharacterized protein n=1 Tax=Tulasnella calospora MUT 4182 TaxID=1051891 RepID=A0A0C3L7Z3_9AGAM|nr:hypothetical protein M407DRAFT_246688 [Tulasnella calospora MUT 4182]